MDDPSNVDPLETAGRRVFKEPPRFTERPKRIHDSVARSRLVWTLLGGFVLILGTDVYESSRYWHDLHDVPDTIAPFVTLFAGAIGSAITFYFTDRGNQQRTVR